MGRIADILTGAAQSLPQPQTATSKIGQVVAAIPEQEPAKPPSRIGAVLRNIAPVTSFAMSQRKEHPILANMAMATPIPGLLDLQYNVMGRPLAAAESGIAESIAPAPKFTPQGQNIAVRNPFGAAKSSFLNPAEAPTIAERVPYTDWERQGSAARLIPRALAEGAIQYGLAGGLTKAVTGTARAISRAPAEALQKDILATVIKNRDSLVSQLEASGQKINPDLFQPSKAVPGATDFDIMAARAMGTSNPQAMDFALKQRSVPRLILRAIKEKLSSESGEAITPGEFAGKVLKPDAQTNMAGAAAAASKAPTFFSALQKTIEQKMPNSAPAEQVRGILRSPGVKKEEIDELEIEDYLQANPKVSKQDLLEHIRSNNVQVKEVVKGEPKLFIKRKITYKPDPSRPGWFEIIDEDNGYAMTYVLGEDRAKARVMEEISKEAAIKPVDETKHNLPDRVLPGGTNYRELLLTIPEKQEPPAGFDVLKEPNGKWAVKFPDGTILGGWNTRYAAIQSQRRQPGNPNFQSSHFDEPNILAHVRFNDRVDAQGNKVLFIEEIQSDWHQKGRQQGYHANNETEFFRFKNEIEKKYGKSLIDIRQGKVTPEIQNDLYRIDELYKRYQDDKWGNAVPDAPFKKTWHELALKRMIRWAAENGYDKLAWTTGEQQAERYDLSKYVDTVHYNPETHRLIASKGERGSVHHQRLVDEQNVPPEKLADYIGKDAAKKIMEQEPNENGLRSLSGLDLKVGGEFHKMLYDRKFVNYLNDYAKKWGGRVQETRIPTKDSGIGAPNSLMREKTSNETVHSIDITPAMKGSVIGEGQPLFQQGSKAEPSTFASEVSKINAILARHGIQNIIIRLVDAITTPQGTKALGSFVPGKRLVKLTHDVRTTTGYHEAFHVLVRRAGLEVDARAAIEEVKRIYENVNSDRDAEEVLAEEFAKYAEGKTSPKWTERLISFFKKLLAKIKEMFGKKSREGFFEDLLNPKTKSGEIKPFGSERFQESSKTPTPPGRISQPTKPLVKARNEAIRAVRDDLREQSRLMLQESANLKRRVIEAGGIKPNLAGGLREELQAIRPFLRSNGSPIDTLATELGFEDGEALRQALLAVRGIKIPTLDQLYKQAVVIVDSEPGRRILDVIQAKGASSQAIKRVVKEVASETKNEIAEGLKKVRGLLRVAQQKSLTPSQIGRIAKEQRITYGETTVGPRGGEKPAPLSEADIKQVEARAGGIVPPRGQPTGTPPVIPRNRSLIEANVPRPERDLNTFQSTPLSGLDPSRAAQIIDGKPLGPTEQKVIRPLRQGEMSMRRDQQRILHELRTVSGNMRRGSKEAHQVFLILENRLSSGTVVSPKVRETAAWLAKQFDELLDRVNEARASVGKRPIQRRKDYITHITESTFWQAMREAFGNVPDDASQTLADKFYESLKAKGPGFRFGLPRKGGPAGEDAIAAFEAYLPAALRVQHLSVPAKLAAVYVNRNLAGTPNASKYFSQLISQTATGESGPIAKMTPEAVLRASNWLRGRFGKGTILGNLSSVLQQVYTLPATISATGPNASTVAAFWLSRGNGLSFALQWSTVLQSRAMELDTELQGLMGKWDSLMASMFQAADQQMVAHSFLSGYVKAVSEGKSFQEAIEEADLIAQRTQSSFLKADTAPVFRDAATAGFLQFQGTVNGVFNFIKFDIPQSKNPLKAAALFVGTFVGLAAIYDALGLPRPGQGRNFMEGVQDFIPGVSTMRSGGPVGLKLLSSFLDIGNSDPQKRAEAFKNLGRSIFVVALGSGANQFLKSVNGLTAVASGGKYDRRGRLQFPVKGPAESARAIAFGPYQTKAGQAYIRRGFRPEPLSESQKATKKAMKRFEKSLLK